MRHAITMLVGDDETVAHVTGVVFVSADGSEYEPIVDGVRWQFGGREYGPEVLTPAQLHEAEDLLCEEARKAEKAAGVAA